MLRDASIFTLPKSFLQKIYLHLNLYKAANPNKRFLLANYTLGVLLYRRVFCVILALPLLLLYFLAYPFVKIRFFRLVGSAIGHYAVNTECLLSSLDLMKDDKFINVFYLEHSPLEPFISNIQLHKMWKRTVFILPLCFSGIIPYLDKFIMFFLANKKYGLNGKKKMLEHRGLASRDVKGHLRNASIHLHFTPEEDERAKDELEKLGIKSTDKYICLLVRSNAYNKWHPTWNKPERNADVKTYMKACEYLAEKGYYVLRMGKMVDDSENLGEIKHPRIIDYAKSTIRSDFMDIYLSAHCFFFITTGSGLDSVAQIFRRPILYTNCFVMSYVATWYPHRLFIPKMTAFNKNNQLLNFKETFDYLCDNTQHKGRAMNIFTMGEYLQENGLYLIDNTEDEILDAAKEMEARMTGEWQESEDDAQLQSQFWTVFPTQATDYQTGTPLHGDITIKLGAKFLSQYRHLLT